MLLGEGLGNLELEISLLGFVLLPASLVLASSCTICREFGMAQNCANVRTSVFSTPEKSGEVLTELLLDLKWYLFHSTLISMYLLYSIFVLVYFSPGCCIQKTQSLNHVIQHELCKHHYKVKNYETIHQNYTQLG